MERIFQIAAVILAGVAAFFFWQGNNDGVFVAAVLAAASFFLSVRMRAKYRIDQRKAEEREAEDPVV